jgi:hypothetical protein
MAGSRIPGCPGSDLMWIAPRTPGPLGFNDHADPNVCTLLGDTPGPLGFGDHADPTLPRWSVRGLELAQVVRLDDGTPLALPAQPAAVPGGWAPWMAIAEAQARKFKGAKEGEIEKTLNFQTAVHTGQKTMVGSQHAWCAAFVNWCLSEAGIAIDNETFADHIAAKGRANGFYMVTRDRAKKGEPPPPQVRNPLYVDLPAPVFGAIAMLTNPGGHGHHVGFVYSKPSANEVVLLGGNQSDTIKFSTFNIAAVAARTETVQGKKVTIRGHPDHLMFFVPASYAAGARANQTPLGTDSAETLNERFGITQPKARPGVRESTR